MFFKCKNFSDQYVLKIFRGLIKILSASLNFDFQKSMLTQTRWFF